jgi:hypothetical protein
MSLFRSRDVVNPSDEIAKLGPALGEAITRFGRDVLKESARQKRKGRRRVGGVPTGRPSTQARRPLPHPVGRLERIQSRIATTVLDRRRALEARRRGGPPAFAAAVHAGAARAAGALRERLLTLRRGLGRVRQRLGRNSRY